MSDVGGNEEGGVDESRLVLVPIPSLVSILLHVEQTMGEPLTEEQVNILRDKAVCIAMPYGASSSMAEARGYDDIRPENAWEDWQAIRPHLGL